MSDQPVATTDNGVNVLLADSRPIENQLLAGALRSHGHRVLTCEAEAGAILQLLERESPDVVVISPPPGTPDFSGLKFVHLAAQHIPKVVLLDSDNRDLVVQAFRGGALGVFCLADSSFPALCECIRRVFCGEVWASNRQLGYLLDAIRQVPELHVVTREGERLLTSREEQVVALVADGLSNRNIASELGLSEHTVKKYLFRIFEKLGISNRVELVLYAVHHGAAAHSAWTASA
jgi:DNA-binding NarL/FixJ family response regulator